MEEKKKVFKKRQTQGPTGLRSFHRPGTQKNVSDHRTETIGIQIARILGNFKKGNSLFFPAREAKRNVTDAKKSSRKGAAAWSQKLKRKIHKRSNQKGVREEETPV